jgi:hypothetical protein
VNERVSRFFQTAIRKKVTTFCYIRNHHTRYIVFTMSAPTTKKCEKCEQTKPKTRFRADSECEDGFQSVCKDCIKQGNALASAIVNSPDSAGGSARNNRKQSDSANGVSTRKRKQSDKSAQDHNNIGAAIDGLKSSISIIESQAATIESRNAQIRRLQANSLRDGQRIAELEQALEKKGDGELIKVLESPEFKTLNALVDEFEKANKSKKPKTSKASSG